MNEFYPLRHSQLNKDVSLLKKLEIKQKQLEDQVFKSKKLAENRKFKAHPNLIHSDSDTTASCTPRIGTNFSSSFSNLIYGEPKKKYSYDETKQRAKQFHQLLHEKLSIIDSNPSGKTDFTDIGDSHRVSQKSTGDRFQTRHLKSSRSYSSIGSFSVDSDNDLSTSQAKRSAVRRMTKLHSNLNDNNHSAASKPTTGGEKRRASSQLSSQLGGTLRGIPVSVFETKFKVVVTKSLQTITDIRTTLTKGILPPDGDEEEARRMTRAREFSNRFSRNYLYPLARQLKDLPGINQLNPFVINQKLLSIYQMLQNALQAYQNHLPTTLGDCSYNQLKILMNNIIEVCVIHRNQIRDTEESYIVEFIDTFKINAELVLQKVQETLDSPVPISRDSALKSEQSKISLTKYNDKKIIGTRNNKTNQLNKKLSMYTMTASFRKDAPWKRAVQSLARKKFNVKSKYRTATYKHRPPIQKEPELISLSKLLPARHLGTLKSSRLNSPMNEDFIKTMVETEANGDTHLEKEEWEKMEKKESNDLSQEGHSNKEQILMKLLQFTLKNHNQLANQDDKSQITELLTLLKKEPNDEYLKKVLDGLTTTDRDEKKDEENQQLTLEIVKSHYSLSDGKPNSTEKSKREPKITVTGDKNAQLICIIDDNSIMDQEEDTKCVEDKINQTESVEPAKETDKITSETQTDIKESSDLKVTKSTQKGKKSHHMKLSRLKKSEKLLKPLDKERAVNVIQYKLDFYRHCKNNHMYQKSSTCEPWVLMSKISEEILNQCLLNVAREIEVNDIAEKVYQSELEM